MDALLQALQTMYLNASLESKAEANSYLQRFQNDPSSWELVHSILASSELPLETKLFAAQTLRKKTNYHLSQIPHDSLDAFKDSLILLLVAYTKSNTKVIRTQLTLALALLALQHLTWANPVADVIQIFESRAQEDQDQAGLYLAGLLEFLQVLPEEASDANKTPLTDSEYSQRVSVLVTRNLGTVMTLLAQLSASETATRSVLACLASWVSEVPITAVLAANELHSLILGSIANGSCFDEGIETLTKIVSETRDIENDELIENLYSEIAQLEPLAAHLDDPNVAAGLARLFAEVGEAWNAAIVRNPERFSAVYEVLLRCCAQPDLDVARTTFRFWYMTRQLVTAPGAEKGELAPVFLRLLRTVMDQMRYPEGLGDATTVDLFDGDREEADKFADFRYELGDVLKDCCAVCGADAALSVPLERLKTANVAWQDVEGALFAVRAMARELDLAVQNSSLDEIFALVLQMTDSGASLAQAPRVAYAITLLFGRYTPYAALRPELLTAQFQYVLARFTLCASLDAPLPAQKDLLVALSNALMYFCRDCASHLTGSVGDFKALLEAVRASQTVLAPLKLEIADGVSHVLSAMLEQSACAAAREFMAPVLSDLSTASQNGSVAGVGDALHLLGVLTSCLVPEDPSKNDVFVELVVEAFSVVQRVFAAFKDDMEVSERIVGYLKIQVSNHTTFLVDILPGIMNLVQEGYSQTRYGCYLWLTGIILTDFNDDYVSEDVKQGVFEFAKLQGELFLQWLSEHLKNVDVQALTSNVRSQDPKWLEFLSNERAKLVESLVSAGDKIEDFFRMLTDLVAQHPFRFIGDLYQPGSFAHNSFQTAILTLNLDRYDTVIYAIRFIMDFQAWGNQQPPTAFYPENPPQVREAVCKYLLLLNSGSLDAADAADTNALAVINMLFRGLIFSFPKECEYEAYDLMGKLLALVFLISGKDVGLIRSWIDFLLDDLPQGSVSEKEKEKVLTEVSEGLQGDSFRKVKKSIKVFVTYYTRKHKRDT